MSCLVLENFTEHHSSTALEGVYNSSLVLPQHNEQLACSLIILREVYCGSVNNSVYPTSLHSLLSTYITPHNSVLFRHSP